MTLTCTRSSKFLSVPPRQMMKRLYLSVPSVTPVRQPSLTLQYSGLPSQPVRSLPLKMATKPSGGFGGSLHQLAPVTIDKRATAAMGYAVFRQLPMPGGHTFRSLNGSILLVSSGGQNHRSTITEAAHAALDRTGHSDLR